MTRLRQGIDWSAAGRRMHDRIADLFPVCRSITGDGLRETLRRLSRDLPLTLREVPSGTKVFDWTVPPEWNVRDAWVADPSGRRVIDFQRSNLHLMGYSVPVRARMRLDELKTHLYSIPEHPDWIPYKTSYYAERWGFCLPHRELLALPDVEYDVCIDATLEPGSLTYGECLIGGDTTDEILVSCHVCHPSLANDNLSGAVVAAALAAQLRTVPHRYSYRFLFIPGTIGSITWLALHEDEVARIKHGLVLANLGDAGAPTYKRSRRGVAEIDRAAAHVLRTRGGAHAIEEFSPYGYDERQYCSPGFDLPVGCLMRTPHGRFVEYHTSADNLDFVHGEQLADSLAMCLEIFEALEGNRAYVNLNPKCEPQLGKRGLYRTMGGRVEGGGFDEMAMLWVLNLSDGRHSLLDIAERSGQRFDALCAAADALREHALIAEANA